jgi:lipid-binding SYLF domain-containing protein
MRARSIRILAAATIVVLAGSAAWAASKEEKKQKEVQEIQKVHKETLAELYKVQPAAKKAVEGSAGYAVFSNFGMKIFVAGGGSGKGVAVDNASRKQTYMKMVEVQAGLGMGVKKFKLVWVFETKDAFHNFVESGWTFGGQASASAKMDDKGGGYTGALAVAPGVWLYQLLGDSLAAELTAKGTKYYKDDDLN